MAQLPTSIKPQEHDTTQTDFQNLPTGIYQLEIIASDLKVDDDENLSVNLTYGVVAPEEYKGRRFFDWIDYQHKDAKKQEDGQRALSRLCRVCSYDKPDLGDTEELHFITFTAKVEDSPAGVSKAGRPYKAKNRIKTLYYPDSGPGGFEGRIPEPAIDDNQPKATPANDNRPAASNDNKPRGATAAENGKKRPWG